MELPEHLGGHLNKTHVDRGTLQYLIQEFHIKSMLDIGCGTGEMVNLARLRNINAYGIDGDWTIEYPREISDYIYIHDFTKGPCEEVSLSWFDLGWSVEFLEHVEEKFMPNYMEAFKRCRYVITTAAPPGYPGHHHVNCRDQEYWIDHFSANGFQFDEETTKIIREVKATMQKPFIQTTGMFFRRR